MSDRGDGSVSNVPATQTWGPEFWPQHPHKSWICQFLYNLSMGKMGEQKETCRFMEFMGHQFSHQWAVVSVRNIVSKHNMDSNQGRCPLSTAHINTYEHMHLHTHVHAPTNTQTSVPSTQIHILKLCLKKSCRLGNERTS